MLTPPNSLRSFTNSSWRATVRTLASLENGLRVERYFQLTADVVCACSITKDYILDVMAEPANMFFAYDGRRKLTDYLTRVVKPENFQKRNLEVPSNQLSS